MIPKPKKTKEWNKVKSELKVEFDEKGVTTCEIRLLGCLNNFALGFAHTKKRRNVTDLKRVVLACVECHHKIEYNSEKWTGKTMEDFLETIIKRRSDIGMETNL